VVPIVLAALVFYALLPLAGAWRVRRSWARFRQAALRALGSPEVDFSLLQSEGTLPGHPLRLTGTLEAFEGRDRLWIGNDRVSAAVSLRGVPVYFIDEQAAPFAIGVDPPRKAEAASLGALPEGTQFLVAGTLARDERGLVHFASGPDHGLLVLAFEGDPSTVLTRAVYAGRPVLDHWNSWTPVSLGVGFLFLLVLAYAQLRPDGDRSSGLVGLALALLPSTFFLPPGILFFYGFARLWARARDQRARSDLSRATGRLATQQQGLSAPWCEAVSQLSLALGILLNAGLLVVLLRLWVP
jgi:hypothetical protein